MGIATWTGGDVPAGCALGHSQCLVRNANVQCLDGRSLGDVLGVMARRGAVASLASSISALFSESIGRFRDQSGRIQPVN